MNFLTLLLIRLIMEFKILESKEIDKFIWDSRVDDSENRSLFGYSWYLDIICPNWCALIIGDYEYFLPLPYKKFLWWKIVYVPPFSSRFTFFSKHSLDVLLFKEVINFLSNRFKFLSFNIEEYQSVSENIFFEKKYFQKLKLENNYSEIYINYSKSHKRNLLKSQKNSIEISETKDFKNLISMQKELFFKKNIKIKNKHFERLSMFFDEIIKKGLAFLIEAKKDDNVFCSILFLEFKNYVTIFSATNEEGKKNGAFFLLMDYYIRKNSNSQKIIDFAGSSIKGIKERNLGFGAEDFEYFSIWSKDLYKIFNILKKRH